MANGLLTSLTLISLFSCIATPLHAFNVLLDRSECFIEEVKNDGDLVTASFVVEDGQEGWGAPSGEGVDLVVLAPTGYSVYTARDKTEDHFSFRTVRAGDYQFCFQNKSPHSTMVTFDFHAGHTESHPDAAQDGQLNPMQAKVDKVQEALWSILADQNYLRARSLRHMKTTQSTSKRVMWYTLLETAALIGASVLQVYVLKSFFNKRVGYNRV
eukprot:TRINITY_DN2157_c0_g6_i1.p1 TRINITY_DN2157_c0_g6~~TRINITY_DN2157_c0_g6_i1.p1  ORF type:complete len:213 (+),score=36.96 TRINITY_DN2157_c0_g6_i1:82-720(+)